ncbi:hypothetical protein Geob_1035 [Geotalea daltonii FRC-32]|uniref:Uncharacterized protein n=1 Tax=Geotalea daltonii (strain DSM 22248 / JCM 15807 / FRC-32) TaxID=316067 RepID=B9M2L7_GEODF|nr:hypothetical protein [Geotalea daltonii]ACM19396.1 hypothetical protein Geob_1035 [Geotalea daltonii FRC-32]
MAEIKELILALFFAQTIILTQSPISISENWTDVPLNKPLKVINEGATLYVDVTEISKLERNIEKLDKMFPKHCLIAILQDKNGQSFTFMNESAYSFTNKNTSLILVSSSRLDKKTPFIKLKVKSSVRLKNVKISWSNYEK